MGLDVDTAHPVAFAPELFDEMASNETAGTADKSFLHGRSGR
jgi:hypothetical protein